MSLNVGTLAARFGLDSSEFLDKMRGVSGATQLFSSQMKREMGQASREGAESLHLLDHALGIQLPRSMNRLLTREFPAFGAALQSILGVGAVGVLAEAGFEFGEKIAKWTEKAKKAQQDYDEAIRHTAEVIKDFGSTHARTMREIELRMAEQAGKPGAKTAAIDFKIDTEAVDKAKKQIAEISAAMEKAAKEAENLGKWTTQLGKDFDAINPFSATTEFWSRNGKEANEAQAKFESFKRTLDDLFQMHSVDPLQGLRDSLKKTSDELSTTGLDIARKMAALQAAEAFGNMPGHAGAQAKARLTAGISPEALKTEQTYFDLLTQEQKLLADILTEDQGHRKVAAGAESRERELRAMQALAALQRDISTGMGKLLPEVDPIKKLATEISGFRMAAENDFRDIAQSAASALDMRTAKANLDQYERRLDEVMLKARRDKDIADAAAKLPANIAAIGQAPVFGGTHAMPTKGAGGLAGAQFDTFANDQAAQLKRAAEAYELALTPQQKYKVGEQELDLLVQKGLIDKNAYKAAMAQLDQQLVKAADSAHKLQEEMLKLLERSNDTAAGIKAFGIQLQIAAAENGKFAYDLLTQSTKGAEEDVTKSLFAILEEQRGGHLKLIHDLEALWSGYFKNLATMGMKHGMDQLMGPLGKAFTGGKGFAGTAMKDVALNQNTHALMALTARMGFSGAPGAGGGAGGGFPALPSFMSAPFMAEGGDATPGSSFISGEAGAERVDLGAGGGAHITPLGVTAGDTNHYYDMRGSVVTEDLMRRSEAAHAIRASESRMLSAMPAMQREISLRKRT